MATSDPITLGIDPGIATVGFACVTGDIRDPQILNFGCFTTPAGLPLPERLGMLKKDLEEILETYKPATLAIETIMFDKNKKTAIDVAQARGMMIATCYEYGLRIVEFSPLQVKSMVTGDGRADKIQMQTMVKKVYNLDTIPKPDDAADALGIAWCGMV